MKRNSKLRGNLYILATHEGFSTQACSSQASSLAPLHSASALTLVSRRSGTAGTKGCVALCNATWIVVWLLHCRNNGKTSVIDTQLKQRRNESYRLVHCVYHRLLVILSFLITGRLALFILDDYLASCGSPSRKIHNVSNAKSSCICPPRLLLYTNIIIEE